MHFLTALINQNNDLTQRYDLNIVILIDGLAHHEEDYVCPHLNFYQMPSYLALVRYLPAALSVFINSLPNIQFKLYVAPTSSLVVTKNKVGLNHALRLTEPKFFHKIYEKTEQAFGPKKNQIPFALSDYWYYKKCDDFVHIDKSFCLFADQLQDNKVAKSALVSKILFLNQYKAIFPHHAPFEALFRAKEVEPFQDKVIVQNEPDYRPFEKEEAHQKLYMTAPAAFHNNHYYIAEDQPSYEAIFKKLQSHSVDHIVKTYPIEDVLSEKKMIKIHTIGQKILPMGFEAQMKYHQKKNIYSCQIKKTPFILDEDMLKAAAYFHKYLRCHSSIYQTYYLYKNPKRAGQYDLHKTISSDAEGYSKIAVHMEKHAKKLKKKLQKMPQALMAHIDILPINHLIYIPIFNQFLRQKNARMIQKTADHIKIETKHITHHHRKKSGS